MLSEQWDTKGSSSNKSTWQNRLRSLSKEMVSRLETLTVLSEMWSSGDFVFVLLSFLNVMYRAVLIGVDLADFVEIHHDLIASWSSQYLVSPVFSNVLQTSTNTLNLSASFSRSLSCFGSYTFFWHTKHSFASKAFSSFFGTSKHVLKVIKSIYFIIEQVMFEMRSIFWLLALSKITLIHLMMCMLVQKYIWLRRFK